MRSCKRCWYLLKISKPGFTSPLKIVSSSEDSIEVVDSAGEKIEIKKGKPIIYEFKDRKL